MLQHICQMYLCTWDLKIRIFTKHTSIKGSRARGSFTSFYCASAPEAQQNNDLFITPFHNGHWNEILVPKDEELLSNKLKNDNLISNDPNANSKYSVTECNRSQIPGRLLCKPPLQGRRRFPYNLATVVIVIEYLYSTINVLISSFICTGWQNASHYYTIKQLELLLIKLMFNALVVLFLTKPVKGTFYTWIFKRYQIRCQMSLRTRLHQVAKTIHSKHV